MRASSLFGLAVLLVVGCGGNVVVDGLSPNDGGGNGGDGGSAGGGGFGGFGGGIAGAAGEAGAPPTGGGGATGVWEAAEPDIVPAVTPCGGDRFVTFSTKYNLWVAAVLCDAKRYKLYLSDTKEGQFFEIADDAGSGQDHCELVNPGFTIPDEDDITSGGCKDCDIGPSDVPITPAGYARSVFGEPFTFQKPWPDCCDYTPQWYSCGVSIP